MLKTLELLTDHCKVSRIFNNLHVTRNPAIFGAEQTVSPASPCQGSQQKPLLHSSLTWQNRQKVLNTEPRGTALSTAKIPYFPKMKWKTGMTGGSLVFKGQWKVSDPLLELSLEHRHGKKSTAPARRQHNPDIAVFCTCSLGKILPRKWSGADSIKIQPRPCCFFLAPAPLPFSPHQWKALLKTGRGKTLCICTVLAFEAFCPAGKVCAHRSAKPWMCNIFTVFCLLPFFVFGQRLFTPLTPPKKRLNLEKIANNCNSNFCFKCAKWKHLQISWRRVYASVCYDLCVWAWGMQPNLHKLEYLPPSISPCAHTSIPIPV